MSERILLGYIEDKEPIYLYKHSWDWDCGWYWGMGYTGNENCHFHFESLLKGETSVNKIFPEGTSLTQTNWWVLRDLAIQAYALKKAAEVYRHKVYQTAVKGTTDKILDAVMAERLNQDLKTLLDTIWEYLTIATSKQ